MNIAETDSGWNYYLKDIPYLCITVYFRIINHVGNGLKLTL